MKLLTITLGLLCTSGTSAVEPEKDLSDFCATQPILELRPNIHADKATHPLHVVTNALSKGFHAWAGLEGTGSYPRRRRKFGVFRNCQEIRDEWATKPGDQVPFDRIVYLYGEHKYNYPYATKDACFRHYPEGMKGWDEHCSWQLQSISATKHKIYSDEFSDDVEKLMKQLDYVDPGSQNKFYELVTSGFAGLGSAMPELPVEPSAGIGIVIIACVCFPYIKNKIILPAAKRAKLGLTFTAQGTVNIAKSTWGLLRTAKDATVAAVTGCYSTCRKCIKACDKATGAKLFRELNIAEVALRRQTQRLCFEKAAHKGTKKHLTKLEKLCSDFMQEGKALDAWKCPITHALMKDPVIAADDFTYERAGIQRWIDQRVVQNRIPTSPRTNLPLTHTRLDPNDDMRERIMAWKRYHPDWRNQL